MAADIETNLAGDLDNTINDYYGNQAWECHQNGTDANIRYYEHTNDSNVECIYRLIGKLRYRHWLIHNPMFIALQTQGINEAKINKYRAKLREQSAYDKAATKTTASDSLAKLTALWGDKTISPAEKTTAETEINTFLAATINKHSKTFEPESHPLVKNSAVK